MEQITGTKTTAPAAPLGWLIAPLAVLLALAAIKLVGIDFELTTDNLAPMLIVGVAGILGLVPSMLNQSESASVSKATLSLSTLAVALIGAEAIYLSDYGAFSGLLFAFVTFGVHFMSSRGRHEIGTIIVFIAMGINVGMVVASDALSADSARLLPDIFNLAPEGEQPSLVSTLNLRNQAIGYLFFSSLTIFAIVGTLVATLTRGILTPVGESGWFSFLNDDSSSAFNKNNLPLQIALVVWALAHIGSLWNFETAGMADKLAITTAADYHGVVGYWQAFFTGMVALIVAGMFSERWHTRAMTLGSLWTLYVVSTWFDAGMVSLDLLEGNWGSLIWLGLTFFIGVAIYSISTHETWGGWVNRDDHEYSGARQFWNQHWSSVMIGLAFFFGLVIRTQWYVVPSMNAFGTGNWDMTGGSDPWYMKRVVDYILANNAHLIFDADRFYPVGGINPRPPIFTWSIAVVATLLEPFFNNGDAVWWAILSLPAVYGTLTILPVAYIAREHINEKAAVVAAWLIAFMPAHVSHTTWALADHDAFIMLFITLGFMFWLRAVKYAGSERLMRTSSPSLLSFIAAFKAVAQERRAAFSAAVLAGVSFGIVSLGWKGFVVGPSILFLAYAAQVALNMFRRRDSTTLNVLFLTMLAVNFLMALPFYGHPQIDLILNGTGLQPFLFIAVFAIAISFVTTGFRDKPWLLVLGVLAGAGTVFFIVLWLLKEANISNAWDVLFTGSGYFTKTKIFGTVAEANAPNRGQLFAQFGPITFVLSLIMGVLCLWSALRERKQTKLVFGVWIIAASFMAWTAARFMFNATPAIAVLGAWGIVSLWKWANWEGMVKAWKKMGIRSPEDRIRGARKALWRTPSFSAIMLVMIMLFGQQFTYGLDAAIPSSNNAEDDLDETIYNLIPDAFRWEIGGFSLLDDSNYDGNWYLGSFGSGFNDNGWNSAYEWLAEQDQEMAYSERPAFVSWWDYGFQALDTGEHPSVSDNFQSGIPATGNMLLARSQEDLVSMFIFQLGQGDLSYNEANAGDREFTNGYQNIVDSYLTAEQMDLFEKITLSVDIDEMVSFTKLNSYEVYRTNDDTVLARGYHQTDGVFDDSAQYWRVYDEGERLLCTDSLSTTCVDGDWSSEAEAENTFSNNIRTGNDNIDGVTHYIIGDYWYTADLVEEYGSVSTQIHRRNAQLALTVQLLSNSLDSDDITDMYDDLINMEGYYKVQDYEGAPGETIERDHEIRYYAIDNRLYPRAGRYTADMNYNQGQPMGIFGAPTILSGQDVSTYMDEVYETIRGDFPDEMTRAEVDEAITQDFLNQQSGADIDPLQVEDVRVDHNSAFFDTMLARAYVGYGASTLGVDAGSSNPQPAQHFGQSGSPGSILSQGLPLPGAMTNHFVIANWYSPEANSSVTAEEQKVGISSTNTLVKILKYYSGAEISGQVTMTDNGQALPGVRLLIERDAFSGEGTEDLDPDTYWVPIGYTDADENGHWSFDAPAGRIRVSAYAGDYNPTTAQDNIRSGAFSQGLGDILTETNEDRQINDISAILGEVANMSWLGENQQNITAEQADSNAPVSADFDISVESSGISGQVTWSGHESFDGDALVSTDFVLRNIWSLTENYTLTTTNGSFTSTDSRILQGSGEVTFTENGTFESEGVAFADGFTGTFTRSIGDKRVYTSNGTWDGKGTLVASWVAEDNVMDCLDNETAPMPENSTICVLDATTSPLTYLLDGGVEANGRLTSDGVSTLVTEHVGDSFEATGSFEGIGTLNGTGLFIGIGDFSGEMVQPGSFYLTGLIPGVYNMIAQLDNGKEVLLPDPVNVGISPSYDLAMSMPGSIFEDTLQDFYEEAFANEVIELVDVDIGMDSLVEIHTDEDGNFSYGPLATGEYFYRVDVDNDGWYELNETIFARGESENFSLAMDVPEMYDVSLQLTSPVDPQTQTPYADVAERTVTFTNDDPQLAPLNATSDETGMVYIELPMGAYTISDESGDDYILFDYIVVEQEDVAMSSAYAIATWVNGSIRVVEGGLFVGDYTYADWASQEENFKFEQSLPPAGLDISFVANELAFSATVETSGNFSVRLPSGNTFHMTAQSLVSQMSAGQLIELTGDAEKNLGLMYLEPTVSTTGLVFLYDNSTLWDSLAPGYAAQEVIATDSTGLEWRTTIDDQGGFIFDLQAGDWDFTVDDALLNSTTVTDYAILTDTGAVPTLIELFVNPEHLSIELNIFMDSGADGIFANGTGVSPAFSLVPLNNHGQQYNFTADDYTSAGNITVVLEPGLYSIDFNATEATDENATDYYLIGESFFETLVVGIEAYEDSVSYALRNEFLVTGVLTNSSGDGVEKQFLLRNAADDLWHNIASDVNGSFASYVPAGDWVAIVAPFSASNDSMETYREAFTVSDDASMRTGLNFSSIEVVTVNFQVQELYTDSNMSDVRITLVSHDGFGNVTLSKSDVNGNVSETIMPGTWSMFLNQTEPQRQWSLDTFDAPFSTEDAVDGVLNLGIVSPVLNVEIGGKVFWDLDDNDLPGGTEGVSNTTVTILGLNNTEVDTNVSTDEFGVWSLFVPIQDEYQVTVSKEGFSTEVYNVSNTSAYPVYSSPESYDIEMTAGNVTVSGNVTDINDAERLNGSVVKLFPSSGMAGEPIVVSSQYANEQLTWSSDISPGEWIVVVTEANAGENGGGVAIGLLDASISDGATLDLEMSLGGWLDLTTTWTDIQLDEYHAGSASNGSIYMNETAVVTIAIGEELEWDLPVGADGTISVLMPASEVEMDSSFITIQHDLELEMEYIGGAVTTIAEGRSPVSLSYTRSINSDTSIAMVEGSAVNATVDGELAFTAVEEGEGYQHIEFDLELNYEGTETVQVFDVLGQIVVSPDEADWKIEFKNGSTYEDAYQVSLGIGNSSEDTSVQSSVTVGIRITVANQSTAWHLEEPHTLKVRMLTDNTPSSEIAVTVQVPQIYDFETSDEDESIGIGAGGNSMFGFVLENTGNGDDSYTVELSDNIPEGWEITPMSSVITIAKGDTRSQMFTAFAPEDFDSGSKVITVIITSEDGVKTDSFDVEIVTADINLMVDQGEIATLSDNIANRAGKLVIPIKNSGFLGSDDIVVSASIQGGRSLGSQTVSIEPEGTTNVTFDLEASDAAGTVRYDVRIEIVGEDSAFTDKAVDEFDFKIEYYIDETSDESPLFTILIVVLGALVLYGGVRISRRSSKGSRF
ncbi:glycosyltransferase family 39 protein [Euryarchaeota archaeon]|nr:glycosyltransferase family 39 protein [Euryarchaeota archaeon]